MVRVYFSTRAVDPSNGKYLSHIAFVDLAHDLHTVLRVSDAPVLPLGGLGCFDEHGIFPMNPVRVGELLYGYTTGWNRRVSVSVDTAIGLAISRDDGLTFQRIGDGPVLGPSLHEPCLVGDAFVRHLPGQAHAFHMWYNLRHRLEALRPRCAARPHLQDRPRRFARRYRLGEGRSPPDRARPARRGRESGPAQCGDHRHAAPHVLLLPRVG